MHAKDSFFQNLSVAMHPQNRIEFEAIGFAIGCVRYAYRRLGEAALELARTAPGDRNDYDVTPLFVNAWSVIDNVRQARELVRALKPNNPKLIEFLAEAEPACLLRNKADHIHQNLPNIAAQKGVRNPLFGSLSFIIVEDRHLVAGQDGQSLAAGGRAFAVQSGRPVEAAMHVVSPPGDELIERPVGLIKLNAFGELVSLSKMAFAVERVATVFETEVRPKIEAAVRAGALAAGLDVEQILKAVGGGVILEAEVEWRDI